MQLLPIRITGFQNCFVCKQSSDNGICQYCRQDLTLFDIERYHHNLMLQPKIKQGLAKVNFPQILALTDYQWPLSTLLTGLKFSAKIPHAHALATLFVEHCLSSKVDMPQVIIPMPLHSNRYWFRKFNQSIELAKHISRLSQVKMDTSMLSRAKSTQAQTKLTAAQRRKNLRQAFDVNRVSQKRLQEYQHVALFDDVITTGATMNAAYKTLIKHHPTLKIDIWSICLTLSHQ